MFGPNFQDQTFTGTELFFIVGIMLKYLTVPLDTLIKSEIAFQDQILASG